MTTQASTIPTGAVIFCRSIGAIYVMAEQARGRAWLRTMLGERVSLPADKPLPYGYEALGMPPPDLGPAGWMALRDGVLAAQDHSGRAEAVRTATERAVECGPAGSARVAGEMKR